MHLCHAISIVCMCVGQVSVDKLILTWCEGFFCQVRTQSPNPPPHQHGLIAGCQLAWFNFIGWKFFWKKLHHQRKLKKKKQLKAWLHGTDASTFCQDFSSVSILHLSEELWLDIRNTVSFLYLEDVYILSCRLSCSCLFLVCCTSLRFCQQKMEFSQMLKEYLVLHVIQLLTRSVLKNGGSVILNATEQKTKKVV